MKNTSRSSTQRSSERGNVLFYILIAVALLAALSFAVAQSSRGNMQQLTEKRAALLAGELIEYSNIMSSAVAQLRLRGVANDELCFDEPSWPADYDHAGCTDTLNRIFDSSGGGVIWVNAPADAMDAAATPDNLWHFYGSNEIEEIGTTLGNATSSDLIMVVDELNQEVCIAINEALGIVNPVGIPPTDTDFDETLYKGAFTYAETIADEAGGSNFTGKAAGCFQRTAAPAEYVFYKTLIAR